ncbi:MULTISPECIES: hypothetical protein [Leuconostoc]|jgi:hypothetical protein|uniref:Uncharacterized protein n=1 Tax=Leuconostoc pseudomesenteroides TaxID=33968 RepID=A0A5B8T216_LEUPS|nr:MULTISPECIES: hypothetical protein [Leuconostoc]MBK0041440.1 hypothetical protein [Leuconostoc sp. S51]MBK0052365.1 hypothetical protein [Leuconostoc sp. S50]MBS0958806.1 hypothetical protein [Leuconostoc pseudomesenteroides]MCT4381470.1 hypothetical protein [Leuconostoc pseudomesenteroides]QEA42404.1 hypothetical protein FGL85_07780 [Leuconostoc pseudomesenteroides]
MEPDYFEKLTIELNRHPHHIIDLNQWLFVTINTAKSIIDNSDKSQLIYLKNFFSCTQTSEVQQVFDTIQGKFGDKYFSEKNSSNYQYLCSLVANFPTTSLTDVEHELISSFVKIDKYLLYENL